MRLMLSGGGSGKQTETIDKEFASWVNKEKPLLYIPIAIDEKKHPYLECLKWLKSTFENLGIKNYEMVTEDNLNEYAKKNVSDFGGIYIGGGNTPYLLKKLKESGMWEFLEKAVKEDVPIYGGSAGAIIFSKNIRPSLNFDKNEVGLTEEELSGMNLTKGNFLFCHFNESKEDQINKIISEQKTSPAILLPETSGLSIIKDKIVALGNAWIIDKEGNKKKW